MTPEEVRRALKEGKTPASVLAEMRGKGTPASEKPADVSPVEAPKDTGTPETPAVPHDPETRFRQRRSSRPPPPVGPHATRASSLDARGREADAEANLRDLRDPQAAYQKQREREHADAAASALPAKPSVAQRAARGALEVASLGMGSDEFKDRLASGKTWTEDVKPVVALAGVGIAHGLKNTASGRLAGTLLEEPVDTFAADTAAEIQTRAAREREAAQRKEKNPDYILSQHIADGLFSGPMPKDRRKANQELHTRLIESKMAAWQAAHPGATQGEVDAKRPEMAKAATADMIQLSKEGQWFWEVTPDDLQREDPSWPQVLFEPKQSFTAEGDIAQSESVPMWALDLIGKTDYLATTAAEEVVPSLREKGKENAGFKERLKSNLWNRRDLVTATIESDPQIQADLASGDGGRIADAEKKLIVPLVLSMLTPDTLTPLGYAKRANQIRKLGVLKAFDTARTAAAPARPLQKVRVAMEALDKVEAEMKAAARVEENAKRVARARAVFEETGNVDQALAQIGKAGDLPQWLSGDPEGWVATTADAFRNKPNAALARYLKEEATAIAAADPEVAAYLEHLQDPAKVLDEDAQAIVDAGRAKFPEAERAAMRQALDEVQALSKGESRTRTVRKVTVTDEPSVATKGVEEKIGKRVTPERARRIADASTPAELREALAGMPAEVYEATARRLGFGDDVEEFKAALRTDPDAVNDALRMTRAEALDAENKVREALDREAALNAAPEQIADIARKRAAMKAAEKEAKEAETLARKLDTSPATPAVRAARDTYRKELDALENIRTAAENRDGFKMPRWLDEQYAKIVRDEELLAGKTLSAEKRAVEEKKIAARYAAYDEAEQKAFNEFDTRMAAKEDVAQKRVDAAKAAFDKEVQKARTAQEAHAAARADAEEKLAAARKKVAEATDAYNTAAAKKPPTVRQGNAGIVQAENAQKAIAQKRKALEDLRTKEADLQRALERHGQVQDRVIADRPDMQNIADAYVAQGPIKTEQVVTEEVYELGSDPQLLVDALDRIDRMRRTIEPKSFKTASFFQRTFQVPSQIKALFYDHWGDVEGRSLAPHVRAAMRRLDGAMDDVGRRLSAGVRAADETATDVNKAAFQDILAETVSFKDGLISKRMPSEFVWSIVYAYAGNRSLSEGDVRRLVRLVSDWSITDESAEMLANRVYDTMLDINGGTPVGLNPRQIGDVNVAIGLGKGGASAEVQRTMGFGLSKNDADAAAQWVSSFSRGAPMSPRAAEGRRAVVEHILRPDAYVPPNTKPFKAWNDKSTPYHVTRPYVEAYTRKGIDEVTLKSLAAGRKDFEKVMDEVFGASEQEFYVPHAVRDVWARHTDAAVNTVRLSNQMDANLDGVFNWWKQAAILGIGVSNPRQSIIDYTGDLLQIHTTPGGGAVLAAKTGVRSLGVQVVNIPGVAQGMTLVDVIRGVERGTAVKAFDRVVGDISCGKGVNAILSRTQDIVGSTGKTGADIYRIATDHGIIENLITSQVGQAMRRHLPSSVPTALRTTVSAAGGGVAGLAVGGLPGALVGATLGAMAGGTHLGRRAILANEDALYDAANVAATRRRLALFVGLLEEGREPNQAAELATKLVGDFSRELSPLEIQTIGRVMPFHAYRKFNMRRVFKALASPWWVESVRDGGEHVSMLLSALFDTDDEYGMQTNAMVDEPDPLAFGQIYDMLAEQDPSRDIQEVWKEAQWISDHGGFLVPTTYTGKDIPFDPETRRSLPLPRALARYERIKARLDAKPYRDALWDLALADDPEIKAYAMYFAPDPIKALAPAHLRDRWKVQLDKSRGQRMALYAEIGSRAGDPAMKDLLAVWPLTPDPNADGLLFPLLAVLTAGKIATLGGVKGSAPADLAQAMTREPVMQSLIALAGYDPGAYAKPIPRNIGENLFQYLPNSWVKRTDALGNIVEPGTEDGTPRVYRYYLNPLAWSTLQLLPGFSKYFVATLQAEKMRAAANGEVMGQKGPVDYVDRWNGWSQFLGQEFYTYDDGTVQYAAEKERQARIDAASETIGATQPVDVNAQQQ